MSRFTAYTISAMDKFAPLRLPSHPPPRTHHHRVHGGLFPCSVATGIPVTFIGMFITALLRLYLSTADTIMCLKIENVNELDKVVLPLGPRL